MTDIKTETVTQPNIDYQSQWDWNPPPCSCGYAGMHTWVGHWFRLLWTRRTW